MKPIMKPTECKYKDITELNELEEKKIIVIDGVKSVKCGMCQKILPYDSEEYFSILGNIMIGSTGGIIGNNFKDTYNSNGSYKGYTCELCNIDIFCIKCFLDIILKVTPRGQLEERIRRYLT